MFQIIIRHFDKEAHGPAYRIAEAHNEGRVADKAGGQEQIQLPDAYEGRQHDDHGASRIASSSQGARQYMIYAVKKQEEDVGLDLDHTREVNV